MSSKEKRYIITFKESHVPTQQVQEILGLTDRNYEEGVNFLSSDKEPQVDDVLSFEKLGIASLTLSSTEVTKLKKNKEILAVEEDVEMTVLEVEELETEETDFDFYDEFDEMDESYELLDYQKIIDSNDFNELNRLDIDPYADTFEPEEYEEQYQRGAEETMRFVLKSLIKETALESESTPQEFQNAAYPRYPIKKYPFPRYRFPRPRIPWPVPFLQPIPWNIKMVKAPFAWRRGLTGKGVKVAVLDTGIASHPDLTIKGGVSFIPGVTSYNDGHSHGTHCAGIIAARNNFYGVVGVAPYASLYAVKVLNDSGSGYSSWIIAGMDWCVKNNIDIASMSLGGTNPPMVAYAHAVRRCQSANVTVVVATGNSFGSSFPWVCSPANSIISGVPSASPIAVGSIDKYLRIANSSSRGGQTNLWNQVDVVAPGVSVKSTILNNRYGLKSGTSMACPHVAGAAALVKQRFGGITPLQIKAKLQRTATDLGRRGNDITFGMGLINCERATR
ncbi:MAG: S8 family peptidase [Flavobacteriaceae bacterium]|nr:S8 family peptidase [Flavobacteriaceae bacterium]